MTAYYNEIDPFAAEWLRQLIAAGQIAPGDVDERSIEDVKPDDLRNYTQCHFFAGIGVWSYALRQIGWPDDWRIWSGSCPCQPFSTAGKINGFADERHLWPAWFHLITQCQPATIVGEQVSGANGRAWLDLVSFDLEAADYAFGALDITAAGTGAWHIRNRNFWIAANSSHKRMLRQRDPASVGARRQGRALGAMDLRTIINNPMGVGPRHSKPIVLSGRDGPSNRVGRLRGYGNAINAETAASFLEAALTL